MFIYVNKIIVLTNIFLGIEYEKHEENQEQVFEPLTITENICLLSLDRFLCYSMVFIILHLLTILSRNKGLYLFLENQFVQLNKIKKDIYLKILNNHHLNYY